MGCEEQESDLVLTSVSADRASLWASLLVSLLVLADRVSLSASLKASP